MLTQIFAYRARSAREKSLAFFLFSKGKRREIEPAPLVVSECPRRLPVEHCGMAIAKIRLDGETFPLGPCQEVNMEFVAAHHDSHEEQPVTPVLTQTPHQILGLPDVQRRPVAELVAPNHDVNGGAVQVRRRQRKNGGDPPQSAFALPVEELWSAVQYLLQAPA